VLTALALVSFVSTACFSTHRIAVSELEKLQTGFEAPEVPVILEGCPALTASREPVRVAQAEGDVPAETNIDPATGCPVVMVSGTNRINVSTRGGHDFTITPFNFSVSATQLVAPDYDLLLARDEINGAEVDTFSTGKTIGLIAAITAVAVGSFLAINFLAPAERGLGGGG
jgi:hypothetical protein